MPDKTASFKIKNPSSAGTIISLFVVILSQVFLLMNEGNNPYREQHILEYFFIFWVIVCIGLLLFTIYRVFQGITEIKLTTDIIIIRSQSIAAKDISAILIHGYFKPTIGIKLKNKRMVPLQLTFRFMEQEYKATRQLEAWAEENGVPLVNKKFLRWA